MPTVNPSVRVDFGDPRLPPRFWDKVYPIETGCWIWAGSTRRKGYGVFNFGYDLFSVHRLSYSTFVAPPPPPTLFVCHSCDNPSCVNPAHLWVGTHTDNMRDMAAKGRSRGQKQTMCIHGHAFDQNNTRFYPDGERKCIACSRMSINASYYKHRARILAGRVAKRRLAKQLKESSA